MDHKHQGQNQGIMASKVKIRIKQLQINDLSKLKYLVLKATQPK